MPRRRSAEKTRFGIFCIQKANKTNDIHINKSKVVNRNSGLIPMLTHSSLFFSTCTNRASVYITLHNNENLCYIFSSLYSLWCTFHLHFEQNGNDLRNGHTMRERKENSDCLICLWCGGGRCCSWWIPNFTLHCCSCICFAINAKSNALNSIRGNGKMPNKINTTPFPPASHKRNEIIRYTNIFVLKIIWDKKKLCNNISTKACHHCMGPSI